MKVVITIEDRPGTKRKAKVHVTAEFTPPVEPKDKASMALLLSQTAIEAMALEVTRLKKAK